MTGESTGELLNSENTRIREPSLLSDSEGEMDCREKRVAGRPGGVLELGMCGHSVRGNRETSERGLRGNRADATGKVNSRTPVDRSDEESDGNIVPRKSTNKGSSVPAELMEGRAPAKRNSKHEAVNRIQGREFASIVLQRVRHGTQYSRQEPYAVVPHVRICAGGTRQRVSLPRHQALQAY